MTAVTDSLSIAKLYEPAQKWIGRITVIWTAWSVLAKFRSVQDVIEFLQRAAHEISANLGWAADLLVFILRESAAAFHTLAAALFAWVPIINLIPPEYRDVAIICFMALVPTLISLWRLKGLDGLVRSGAQLARQYRELVHGLEARHVLLWDKTSHGS